MRTTIKTSVSFKNKIPLIFSSFLRHIFQPKSVHYKYRFQCPDSSYYDPAAYELQLESLESFPWNIADNVVCSHGSPDHQLTDVCFDRQRINSFFFK
jgi:hypothetical protein